MVNGNFPDDRAQYFAKVIQHAMVRRDERLVVVVDPDTGIEPPAGGNSKHIKRSELASIYAALRTSDLLAVYQHRWRDTQWLDAARDASPRA